MNKKYILYALPIAALAGGLLLFAARSAERIERSPTQPSATTSAPVVHTVAFSVEGVRYEVAVAPKTSVLAAMRTLASTTPFTFSSHDFPGLGAFVEDMNGKKNADGFYWILYVNNAQSPKGTSQTFISPGDTVEWRYEKGY